MRFAPAQILRFTAEIAETCDAELCVVVRVRFDEPERDVLSSNERRPEPVKDRYAKIMATLFRNSGVSVSRAQTEPRYCWNWVIYNLALHLGRVSLSV